ncbi:hypothetical protein B0H13DRAFT_2254875 [Mycena leptocephala]|nr:hypothetical protein B0H13DRAFT_2254875 [Mycena leptocephala]
MTSSRSSPVHAASLVDPATHAPALMQLIDIKLDRHVMTVDYAMGRTHSTTGLSSSKFTTFVSTVLARAEVAPATVLVSLVYIHRARPHLSIALEEWALERVFLGSLIVASKYTNDSTLKNVHWALCTGREFLDVLDWDLSVGESDLLAHHEGLLAASQLRSLRASRQWSTWHRPARTRTTAARASPSSSPRARRAASRACPRARRSRMPPPLPLHTATRTSGGRPNGRGRPRSRAQRECAREERRAVPRPPPRVPHPLPLPRARTPSRLPDTRHGVASVGRTPYPHHNR